VPAVEHLVLDDRLLEQLQVGRHAAEALAVVPVRDADLDLLEAREHVELGQVELREAVHHVRVAHLRDVEPAAAARATGRRAELGADAAEVPADVVVQLGRERALAHARAVRLDNADDAVEPVRRDAAALNVEHRGIRALDEHALARDERVVEVLDRVDREAQHVVLDRAVLFNLGVRVRVQVRVVVLVELDLVAQLLAKVVKVAQVAHAHAVTQHLGRVRRPDALLRRADLVAAAAQLVESVDLLVQVEHEVRAVRDEDAALVVHAHALELVELEQQARQVHDHAVADHAHSVRVQDARRHEVELVLLAVVHDRVPGVRAAGHARDHVVRLREVVHELALAFVAPLRAEHHVHAAVEAVVVALRVRHGALDAVQLRDHLLKHRLRLRLARGGRRRHFRFALRVTGVRVRESNRSCRAGNRKGRERTPAAAAASFALTCLQRERRTQGRRPARKGGARRLPDRVEPHLFR
ncbi:hypothetical protein PybrP1_009624, partial [[Pythium] brassicae (nom. inval.)]